MNVLQAILYLNKVWNFFNDFLFLNILIYKLMKNINLWNDYLWWYNYL